MFFKATSRDYLRQYEMRGIILPCLLQKTKSLSMAFIMLLVLVLMALDFTQAIAGKYETSSVLTNKWLPNHLDQVNIIKREDCEDYCVKHKQCDTYAVSVFERKCRIYDSNSAGDLVKNNGYTVYIKLKTEEEGYYIYGISYIRLVFVRMNAMNAAKFCAEEKGLLLPVKNEKIEEIMYKIMSGASVWKAFIGLNDEVEEGKWMYSDGGPASYTNWHWRGMWPRYDLNCALALCPTPELVIQWKHASCWEKHYFFCQIPMF